MESPTSPTGTALVPETATSWVAQASAEGRYVRIRGWVSRVLPTPRDLFIYLPECYAASPERSFPVLLMHDGQNLFDGELSYVHGSTWNVGSTADRLIADGQVSPMLIVGIGNTGVERMAEYTPTADGQLGGGKGPLYARMLVEEILPMLAAQYRVLPGPANTGLAGSSLGGLISLAIALRYPHIFGKVGVVSPSLWWDDRVILRDVRSLGQHLPLRIWLDMGAAEGLRHVQNTNVLNRLLKDKGWQQGVDLDYRVFADGEHNEAAWAARFGDILRFLFPAPHPGD